MNIHKNARTTPYSRLLMARRVAAGEKIVKVAADFCISQQTVRKWVRRWRTGDASALQDRSSRPHRLRRTAPERLAALERLFRQRLSSPAIARQLGVSRAPSAARNGGPRRKPAAPVTETVVKNRRRVCIIGIEVPSLQVFSSRFSSFKKRQSVPLAMIVFGSDLIMRASYSRSA